MLVNVPIFLGGFSLPSEKMITKARIGVGDVKGVTKLKGVPHPYVTTVLMDKDTLLLVRITRSNSEGVYAFRGVPTGNSYLVIAFDPQRKKNAVIQDNRLAR